MTTATLDLQDMQAAAERACELMKVLANPDRLLICCQLSQQEMCVSELESSLGIVQPSDEHPFPTVLQPPTTRRKK